MHNDVRLTTGELPGGGRPTEDRIFSGANAVAVLDGVTTLTDEAPRGGWYAETLGQRLIELLDADENVDLRQALETAIRYVVEKYGLVQGSSPASTVSVLRWNAEQVDALVLADSPLTVFDSAGQEQTVRDDRLAELVGAYPDYQELLRRLASGGGFDDRHWELTRSARDYQWDYLNRLDENHLTADQLTKRWWLAEAVPEAARYAITNSWPREMVASALLMTDGVSSAVDEYSLYPSWQAMAAACDSVGAQAVVQEVHDAEKQDLLGKQWPRYKPHDDKALARIDFTSLGLC